MSPTQQIGGPVSLRRVFALGMAVVLTVVLVIAGFMSFEGVDADEILVVQSPVSGELTWHVTPGIKWQGFGKTTFYKKRSIYAFDKETWEDVKDAAGKVVGKKLTCCGIDVRFNEGGHGTMLGSIQYDMPLDVANLNKIHTKFGSQEAVQRQVIETVTGKAVYFSGPLMSSKESYAERRNDLIHYVEDQIQNGVYKTRQKEVRVKDSLSGQEKTATIVEVVIGKDGKPERQEDSVLNEFGIKAFALAIKKLPYDASVEAQIQQQQVIAMDVQTAIANAKKSEQKTITVTEEGKAKAAEAKWKQEEINYKEIAEAEKNKRVAELNAQAAEQYKKEQILRGQGDAEKKRLVMEADGALDRKLEALVEINKNYATALTGAKLVPDIVMGGGSAVSGAQAASSASQLVELLTAHTARQLGTDLGVLTGKTATEKGAKVEKAAAQSSPADQKGARPPGR